MAISQSEFGEAVKELRPKLVHAARLLLRCSYEDAEDAVAEVVIVALTRLQDYDATTGRDGLRFWLVSIIHHVGRRRLRDKTREVPTVPLQAAEAGLAPNETQVRPGFQEALRSLHPMQRLLVLDWLNGYSHEEIARRLRIHRNTVPMRLEKAFEYLRGAHPEAGALEFSLSVFNACARVSVYRKPVASWLPWKENHPPETPVQKSAWARRIRPVAS